MKEIYFIRHGQTDENSLGIRQGAEIDSELNELGREQAKKSGKYLKKYRIKDKNFDCILSSPLKRAIETAEIIGKELKLSKKIEILDSLIELSRGKMSGSFLISQSEIKNYIHIKFALQILYGLAKDDKYKKKFDEEIEKNKKKLEIQLSIFMSLIWINI